MSAEQSPPLTPIHGYDDEQQPIPCNHQQQENSVTRRQAVEREFSRAPPGRRQTWSGGKTKPLPTVYENCRDCVFTRGSASSLAWDSYQEESFVDRPVNDSRLSTSTNFSVPVSPRAEEIRSDSSDEYEDPVGTEPGSALTPSSVGEVFYDTSTPATHIGKLAGRERFVFSNTSEPGTDVNMAPTKQVLEHRSKLREVTMLYEDDIRDIVFEEVTIDYIKLKVTLAETIKAQCQAAIIGLMDLDSEHYESELKEDALNVKAALIKFVKDAQKVLREHDDSNQPGAAAGGRDPGMDAVARIKADRVNQYQERTVEDLNGLVDELHALQVTEPRTDLDYRKLEDRLKTLTRRVESVNADARQLCTDAVDTGMEAQAKALEGAIRAVKEAQAETETRVFECKTNFGIVERTSPDLQSDIKPPSFNGDPSDKLDFFTFKTAFSEYLECKPLSKSDQLRLLKSTCLGGGAKLACSHMLDIDSVWDYLKDTYGNPKILFASKVAEIRVLGPCQGSFLKKREWGLAVRSKLQFLQNLARTHDIEDELHFSPIVQEIQSNLPAKQHEAFKRICKRKDKTGNVTRKMIFEELLDYFDELVTDFTFEINYDVVTAAGAKPDSGKPTPSYKPVSKPGQKKTFTNSKKSAPNQGSEPSKPEPEKPETSRPVLAQGTYTQPQERDCNLCSRRHTHLQYCERFQACEMRERYKLAGRSKACFRCLRLDADLDFNDRVAWWDRHKANCKVNWECKQGKCATREPSKQYHFLLCSWHENKNRGLEQEYIKSLNQNLIKPGIKFFYSAPYLYHSEPISVPVNVNHDGYKVLPDIDEPAIFMLQDIVVDKDRKLLVFYDSGCMGASLSDRACSILETEVVRPGPTYMSVAGAETIVLETGDERFWLVMEDGKTKATLTGLRMPNITTPFPTWNLQEAWNDIQAGYLRENPKGKPLPTVNKAIGGCSVDVMVGIRYNIYFPTLIHQLPCGLGIYRSKFAADGNRQGILGGTHRVWREVGEKAHLMGPRSYFTAEARAYYVEGRTLRSSLGTLRSDEPAVPVTAELTEPPGEKCWFVHCTKHSIDSGWMIPSTWNLDFTKYSIRTDETRFGEIETLGSKAQYRCVRCRNCNDCRKGEVLERVSLQEETEQFLIESSVKLNIEERRLESALPFIKDPLENLKPNRFVAEKVLESQLKLVIKNPEMREDIIKSHNKLRLKNYVVHEDELNQDERFRMESTPGSGHYIPWRTVHKASSLLTPCRMVFDPGAQQSHQGDRPIEVDVPTQRRHARLVGGLEKDEKLLEYIPQTRKWRSGEGVFRVGDIVISLRADTDQTFGFPVWRTGRVREVEVSKDGVIRSVVIEYKNSTETVFRTTRRSARTVAVLHREGDLELVEELNEAARRAQVQFLLRSGHSTDLKV